MINKNYNNNKYFIIKKKINKTEKKIKNNALVKLTN